MACRMHLWARVVGQRPRSTFFFRGLTAMALVVRPQPHRICTTKCRLVMDMSASSLSISNAEAENEGPERAKVERYKAMCTHGERKGGSIFGTSSLSRAVTGMGV